MNWWIITDTEKGPFKLRSTPTGVSMATSSFSLTSLKFRPFWWQDVKGSAPATIFLTYPSRRRHLGATMGRAERRSLANLPGHSSGILSCDPVSVCPPSSLRALLFSLWSGELRRCQKDRCSGRSPHLQNQNGRLHMARMPGDRWHVRSRGFFAVKAWDVQNFNTSEIATEITHSSRVALMLFLWDRFLPTLWFI